MASQRVYNAKHAKKQSTYYAQYTKTPSGMAAIQGARNRRRAAKLNLPRSKYDPTQIVIRDNAVCNLCGFPVDIQDYHIEHVIPLQVDAQVLLSYGLEHPGDVAWNVSCAHPTCNIRKGNRMTEEDFGFYTLLQYLYKE